MKLVGAIVTPVQTVTAETTGGALYERFEAEPDTLAIAVVDSEQIPVGLIERGQFMLKMGSAHGRPLYGGRSVTLLMDPNPLLVDRNTLISDFTGDALAERPSDLLRGFIAVADGRYAGVGSALSLLQAASDHNQQQALELRELNRIAARDQGRWSMLFHQSPLPQLCYDASELYEALHVHSVEPGRLAARMRSDYSDLGQLFNSIALKEANEAAHQLFGVKSFGDNVDLKHFGEDFLPGLIAAARDADHDGAFAPFEATIYRADATPVDVRVHLRSLAGGERPWSLCMATYVDVTETQRAARVQREATAAAEAANRAKTQFLATMSHEIRTPLNGVLGMAQVMENDDLSPIQKERVEIIRKSGETLLTILNDILDLSKIEAGRLDLEWLDFDLEALIQSTGAPFAQAACDKGVDFRLDLSDAAGVYRGDPVRVRQILSNLLSNAVKFTEAGEVSVSVTATDHGFRMTIGDTGAGIASDRIDKVFEKFVQADSSTTRRFGGTGLGLAICREISEAMGGSISVASTLGEGSVFTVELPLARCASAPAERVRAPVADLAEQCVRILAAEDNPTNQVVLRTLLEQAGVEVGIVENGVQAVDAWAAGGWDLILMDVQMPVMDGPTAARRIREYEAALKRPRIPILALTANAMSHQIQDYVSAGMDGVVAKPIEISKLYDAIQQALAADGGADETAAVAA
ncbi:MAG TPA: ATP-binding protein [Caulobacteraceae bacterium]|jgi:signal transduction histidine kinase|nr:ATP-binding protein [Caulobacteraceae bacterium]